LGVEWHPELSYKKDVLSKGIFESLSASALKEKTK
jgi:gamma-glutamyl-gamma-aminobutyrate hydrolase PuuD